MISITDESIRIFEFGFDSLNECKYLNTYLGKFGDTYSNIRIERKIN